MKQFLIILVLVVGQVVLTFAQSPVQIEKWTQETKDEIPLADRSCGGLNYFIPLMSQDGQALIKSVIGWYARGFVEGALFILADPNKPPTGLTTAAHDFGLSTDVATSHVLVYCKTHPEELVEIGVADLLLKVVQTAKK